MLTLESLKTLFPLTLKDEEITPHLTRATWDYRNVEFEDEMQELEVVGCKAIYYLAPLLWTDMQNKANEFGESLDKFKDVIAFGKVWLDRANSALNATNNDEKDEIRWSCI